MFNFCTSQKCIYNLEDELAASSPLSRRNPCPHSPQDPVYLPDVLERECRGAEETPRGGSGVPAASSGSTQSPRLEGIYSAQKTAQVGIVCVFSLKNGCYIVIIPSYPTKTFLLKID